MRWRLLSRFECNLTLGFIKMVCAMFGVSDLAASPRPRVRVPSCMLGLCRSNERAPAARAAGWICRGGSGGWPATGGREGLGYVVAAHIPISLRFIQKSHLSEDTDVVNFQHVNKHGEDSLWAGERQGLEVAVGWGGLHSNTGLILSPETVIWGC